MASRSDQNRNSRYARGGDTELKGNKLGWWERTVFETSPTDVPFPISAKYHLRPDLLAADVYGRDELMWFILQFNTIVDLHTEFIEGAIIMLPLRTRVYGELLSTSRNT